MDKIIELAKFAWDNVGAIGAIVLSLLAVAEAVVRLTPTHNDDGAVERIGAIIRKVLDFFKVPNAKK